MFYTSCRPCRLSRDHGRRVPPCLQCGKSHRCRSISICLGGRAESGERRAESGERRAESGERRAESGEREAGSGEWRAGSGERRAESGEWRPGERRLKRGDSSRGRLEPSPLTRQDRTPHAPTHSPRHRSGGGPEPLSSRPKHSHCLSVSQGYLKDDQSSPPAIDDDLGFMSRRRAKLCVALSAVRAEGP